jgi:seryl-tRNA synthetase
MLDLKKVREDPEAVKAGARKKRIPAEALVDRVLELDRDRRQLSHEKDKLRETQNLTGKKIASLKGEEKARLIAEMGQISAKGKELEERLDAIEREMSSFLLRLPQLPDPEVPEGETDKENVEVKRWGHPRDFGFAPKDHLALGEALDLIDMPRAAKLAGTRTYILKNEGALLELAVLSFTLDRLVAKGFVPMIVPTLVRREAMVGTAYFPGGEEQAYACEKDELFLIGTSEVPVTAYHSG